MYMSSVFLLLAAVQSVFSAEAAESTKVSSELAETIQRFSRREGYQVAKEMKKFCQESAKYRNSDCKRSFTQAKGSLNV